MAIATIALVGCKKNNDPVPVPTPTPDTTDVPVEEDIPEVDAPESGLLTIVISIPAGSQCNGIALKGTVDGSAWTGANQYLGLEGPASAESCIKFEKIEGNWYKATYKLGTEAFDETPTYLKGKICLIYTDDNDWQGQAKTYEVIEDYTTVDYDYSGDLAIYSEAGGLLYVRISKWNKSECAEEHLLPRKVTFKAPDCGFETPAIVGSFGDGWTAFTPMTQVEGNTYEITVEAVESDEFKIVGAESHWDNEVYWYDAEKDEYVKMENIAFGNETEVVVDYSNGKWHACAE